MIKNSEATIVALESTNSSGCDVFVKLSSLHSMFTSLHRQNSLRWVQRAHLLWLMDGDHNTTFFHNSVRIQYHYNYISQITDLYGNSICEHSDIEITFTQFYSNLWSARCNSN